MSEYSGYYDDAVNHTIPQITQEIEELIVGFDSDIERVKAKEIIRKNLKAIGLIN